MDTNSTFYILAITVIIANYQKNEANNIYLYHLKHLDKPEALKSVHTLLCNVWANVNKGHQIVATMQDAINQPDVGAAGMWSKLGSYMSSFMKKQPTNDMCTTSVTLAGPCLLVLYELIYLNPNFAKSLSPPRVSSSPRTPRSPGSPSYVPTIVLSAERTGVPLIQQFLIFCSCVFVDCSDFRAHAYAKLCLLILTCMSENSIIEDFLHDPAATGTFAYQKSTGSADKLILSTVQPQAGQGLACVLLDTLVLFMKLNLKKKFDLDMYRRSVGIVHRILSHEKKTATRLAYKWRDMWNTLFSVMKQSIGVSSEVALPIAGIANNGTCINAAAAPVVQPQRLSKQQLGICMEIVTLLNLFITYGDSFLPSPSDYDDLYYEIMRASKLLEHFYTIAEKYEHSQDIPHSHNTAGNNINVNKDVNPNTVLHGDVQEDDKGGRIATLSMLNIKTIITHFSGKIQQWNFAHPEVTLTPDMVLRIIKENYDSLKLKLQENLDFFPEYVEGTETPYLRQLTRIVVQSLQSLKVAN